MLKLKVVFLLLMFSTSSMALDLFKTTIELAKVQNFSGEFIKTQTSDGYKLKLFHGKPSPECPKLKPPALLIHGLMCSSDIWAIQKNSILFWLLADCRPTFATNERGNNYCQEHVNYTTAHPQFWNYEYKDIGIKDLLAYITLIGELFSNQPIDCICHSMGCVELLVFLATFPEHASKIGKIILLSPATYMHNTKNEFVKVLAAVSDLNPSLPINMNALEWNVLTSIVAQVGCDLLSGVCKSFFDVVFGPSINTNEEALSNYFARQPAGSSVFSIRHLIQGIGNVNYDFAEYNYNPWINFDKYGTTQPPKYNLSHVQKEVYIFYGGKDELVVKEDVERLSGLLPNPVFCLISDYVHNDFFLGNNLDVFLNPRIMDVLNDVIIESCSLE